MESIHTNSHINEYRLIEQRNSTKNLIIVGIDYCEENSLEENTSYKLSNKYMEVVTIADNPDIVKTME